MKKLHLIILSLFLFLQSGFCNKNMIVQDYTTENGLLHNTVFCAVKDADGFMWFGTWYGLTSFDGVKFKSYNNRDDYNTDIPPHKLQLISIVKCVLLAIYIIMLKMYKMTLNLFNYLITISFSYICI